MRFQEESTYTLGLSISYASFLILLFDFFMLFPAIVSPLKETTVMVMMCFCTEGE